jgi:PEP-CTERM motif
MRNFPLKLLAMCVALGAGMPARAAFNIIQAKGANYRYSQGAACPVMGFCKTRLLPARVADLGAATVAGLNNLTANNLTPQFPGYSYAYGPTLNMDFKVTTHKAFNTGAVGGATLAATIAAQPGQMLPANLHWVQLVTNNWNFTGYNGANLAAPKGIGKPESTIDGSYPQPMATPPWPGSPFYDVFGPGETPFATAPPVFTDTSQRGEPTKAVPIINWDAQLWLVSLDARQITFHNGVNWGWQSRFSMVPEPATWAMLVIGFGCIGALARRQAQFPARVAA